MPGRLSILVAELRGRFGTRRDGIMSRMHGISQFNMFARREGLTRQTMTPLERFNQAAFAGVDYLWNSTTESNRQLWRATARATAKRPRSGVDYCRHVNQTRALFGFPMLAAPPDPTVSRLAWITQSAQCPAAPANRSVRVYLHGVTMAGSGFNWEVGDYAPPYPCDVPWPWVPPDGDEEEPPEGIPCCDSELPGPCAPSYTVDTIYPINCTPCTWNQLIYVIPAAYWACLGWLPHAYWYAGVQDCDVGAYACWLHAALACSIDAWHIYLCTEGMGCDMREIDLQAHYYRENTEDACPNLGVYQLYASLGTCEPPEIILLSE